MHLFIYFNAAMVLLLSNANSSVQTKFVLISKVVCLIKSTLFLVEIHPSCGKSQPNWKDASIWFAFAHIELPKIIFGTVFVHHDLKSRFPSHILVYFCTMNSSDTVLDHNLSASDVKSGS